MPNAYRYRDYLIRAFSADVPYDQLVREHLAGGGIKGGTTYGATDDLGYHAVENVSTVYDLWATVLHVPAVDYEALTYRFGGRDFRLTDVHGNVIRDIPA